MEKLLDQPTSIPKTLPEKLGLQIRLLIWKRWAESTKSKLDLAKVLFPAVLFFVLLILIYAVITNLFSPDGIEPFFVPFAFWIFMQRLVVQIMFEKSSRLQESMRMMGLSDFAYWTSYFISDGIILGFVLSFLCTLFTVGGLFNNANFGTLLGLFFVFCLSSVPFCFFICAFFDTPQTAGQAFLALLLGLYVLYVVVFVVGTSTISLSSAQGICCLIPPLALQIGSGAFLKSYDGINISSICAIMFVDIFIYSALAWYFSQVWPSKVGVPKPWYFIFQYHYWWSSVPKKKVDENALEMHSAANPVALEEGAATLEHVPSEEVNETLLGRPTVVVNQLRKTFGQQLAVNNLSFKMYENQIFALLGHNGAGKTTTISMLTGLISPDYVSNESGAFIYDKNILGEMDLIRYSMGVCPQHDVLFENLTVREHILFFAQLKGYTYEHANREAETLTKLFHLDSRLDHTGSELSGGQKRKLSVAIAVCGGSRFVVLDEPTAGMDPLARRELWDLLASLRRGRTMLLTTHYMDEADVLGDRVAIMSLGKLQCVGSTQFLKTTYGAGYKLIFDKTNEMIAHLADGLDKLTKFIHNYIPEAKYFEEDGAENQILYSLPFNSVVHFGNFFTALEKSLTQLSVTSFGVTITSLEDVFLKVGEDHTVTPQQKEFSHGIGREKGGYSFSFTSQVIGLAKRKLTYAMNDFITLPLLLLPLAASIAAAILYNLQVISDLNTINDLVVAGMIIGSYLGAPGLIAEFLVKERSDKLRNVLTVMGCDFKAYWIGTFIADYLLMLIPIVCLWIMWPAAGMSDFYASDGGLCFFLLLLFNVQLIAFSYFFSFVFSSPKSCISLMPIIILVLVISPNVVILILVEIANALGTSISSSVIGGVLLWGIMIMTPHGALFAALLDTTQDYSSYISNFPPVGASIAFMIVESVIYLGYAYYIDSQAIAPVTPPSDPSFNPKCLEGLDEDVLAEREKAINTPSNDADYPLQIKRLRKVFPPKRQGQKSVIATEDIAFQVQNGEIFGLLGANGAGKTTTLSMLTRHLVPTSGDAFVAGHSILTDFSKGSTHLGVVTQNNSLWDRLSVEAHLKLFARLRGVPEDQVYKVVEGTIDQLELTPHRHKLSMRLSGGMKRKLCVAIALIGDPEVVLLDEPSAGLDPVSRRNLWSVILRTMSTRSVILTTHSMDEAEALCRRIGIMVKGQLRALGTKQHLKYKFGSGYELCVKLLTTNTKKDNNGDDSEDRSPSVENRLKATHLSQFEQHIERVTKFVSELFPSSFVLGENGGLITYEIPKHEMQMGKAFSALEANKIDLEIEDYTIAQPTLEQVFIRTVNKYNDDKDSKAGIATVIGGTGRLSSVDIIEGEVPVDVDELVLEKNKCGCTNYTVTVISVVTAILFVVLIGASIGIHGSNESASSALTVLGILSLIASCAGCNILFCACCQYPKGADE